MREPVMLPGGTGYDDESGGPTVGSSIITDQSEHGTSPTYLPDPKTKSNEGPAEVPTHEKAPTEESVPTPSQGGAQSLPDDIMLPFAGDGPAAGSINGATPTSGSTSTLPPVTPVGAIPPSIGQGAPTYTAPRPYSPQRQPVFMRNASKPYNPQPAGAQSAAPKAPGSLIGPIGYDSE
jgi:hypothetical protein